MTPRREDLVARALDGNRRALARLLTLVENGTPEGRAALAELFPRAGNAHVIGFTGATGAGKSTLVNRVALAVRSQGLELAIVAVDPTSPFSGGALLGDRLRMRDLLDDTGVFIRSMASRGHPGGIAHATRDVVTLFDALGVPVILVETVGAGQVQVEVVQIAHTVVLVEAPGMGDEVQALKAGLMEIADVIVVNKADRPEAKQTVSALRNALRQQGGAGHHGADVAGGAKEGRDVWVTPILETSALDGEGVGDLVGAIEGHRAHLQATDRWQMRQSRHARAELEAWLQRELRALFLDNVDDDSFNRVAETVIRRQQDPASAARELLALMLTNLK